MALVYKNADILIYPTICESFGHGLLEGMGNGLPCIVSDIGVNREIAGDAVLYCDKNNTEDFVTKLKQIISNKQLRIQLGNKALFQSKKYSWENHADKLVEAINKTARTDL